VGTASRLITYEDSFLLPEDKSAEIIRGELRRMPPPSLRHARLIEKLASLLRESTGVQPFEVLVSAFGQVIRKEPFTFRIPDLGVYRRDKLGEDHYIWAVPELLAEVISPANRKGDLNELIADYQFLGAPEVWLLDIPNRRIFRLLRENERLVEAGVFSEGSIRPRWIPETAVPLDELWNT